MLYQWEIGRAGAARRRSCLLARTGNGDAPTWPSAICGPSPTTSCAARCARVDAIDPLLADARHNWRLERMAVIDRLVLRLAVYELLDEPETPPQVVINEAIELARTFSGDDAVRFVNGVLDAVRRIASGCDRLERSAGRGLCDVRDAMTASGRADPIVAQRRANFEELSRLGVDPYPNAFDRDRTRVSDLVGDVRRADR